MGSLPLRALQKWGNSTGVRIPKDILGKANIAEGDAVEFEVTSPGVIVLRVKHPKPTLEDLLKGTTREQFGGEIDWGSPRGHEVW
jgi:antitoxin MazE